MTHFKETVPSEAQAKQIAHLWASKNGIGIAPEQFIEPTTKVLLREGWIEPVEVFGVYPCGWKWQRHNVSAKGLRALHTYFVAKGHVYGGTK